MILERLNGSVTPERFATMRRTFSCVVNLRSHTGQDLRRRMAAPSSAALLSITRVSGWRQNGQCIPAHLLPTPRPTTLDPTKPQLMGLLPSKPTRCCGQPRPLWASPQLCAQTCSAHGRKTTEPVADHKGRGLSAHIDGGPILSARIATVTPEESSPQRPAPTHPFT